MKSFAWYDLQVIICSGIMMVYYWLVLRNKRFHQYNRFYILASFFLSFIIPLIKIQLDKNESQKAVVQFIYVLADYNASIDEAVATKGFQLSWNMVAIAAYAIVSAFFLFSLILALLRIRKLLKQYSCKSLGDVYLILTNVKGTPFSFFKYIFWNEEIDLQTATGQQILQHELTHVKEKHSIDTIITQVVMIFGWFNPFFWWARKELQMIHEFIADKKSVDNGDATSLAKMLLAATYPQQQFLLTNSFFFSPIKRRLLMITNNKNPRFSYMRRVVVLPLMAVVILLFSFRMKHESSSGFKGLANELLGNADTSLNPTGIGILQVEMDEYETILKNIVMTKTLKNGKTITVFNGSKTVETKRAYEIWQAMSTEQREKATQVNFVKLPPSKRNTLSVAQFEKFKNENQYGIWIDDKHVPNTVLNNYKASDFAMNDESNLTGGAKIGKKYNVQVGLYTEKYFKNSIRKDTAIYITKKLSSANKAISSVVAGNDSITILAMDIKPSPLYIVDGKKITAEEYKKILPLNIFSINVLKDNATTLKYGDDGKNGVVEITSKRAFKEGLPLDYKDFLNRNKEVRSIHWSNDNKNVTVNLNDGTSETYLLWVAESKQRATDKYGALPIAPPPPASPRIVTGVASKHPVGDNKESFDKVFTVAQVPAAFPGGVEAWRKYLQRNLNRDLPVKNGAPAGKYEVQLSFIVDDKGIVSNVKTENDPGYGTTDEAMRVIKKGPNWVPAKQNGKNVTSLVKQTITFVVEEEISVPKTNKPLQPSSGYFKNNNADKIIVARKFGINKIPNTKIVERNDGIVIRNTGTDKVKCLAEGTVTAVLEIEPNSKAVILKSGDYYTVYNNLTDIDVKQGKKITKGTVVGAVAINESGNYEFGFSVMKNNKKFIDPESWLIN